ncbi:uncharacterized protein RSE6_04550 [Rhynchosporium secalis]|uniref:Telomere-associated protein Rif1 N-terminal domain-containing protein n=1 Tax=Rhynchosporium secalis TaxID=38038 RepID=A0A1E1M5K0_RHYSE|nr:uncharacterized protein RSE6_04550 [Rhynchosporium secalis]
MVESVAKSNTPPPLEINARPPTPPRNSSHKELKLGKSNRTKAGGVGGLTRFLKVDAKNKRASAPASTSTAVDTLGNTPGSGGSRKKKVVWAESSDYNEPPTASFDGQKIRRTVQPLAPSSERKPTKSILKISTNEENVQESNNGTNTKLLPPHHHASFATMLDSIVQQLGGKDRSSKMDAYLMFSSLLKASDNVPDMKALKSKMSILCQFIIHDLSEKLENGKSDTSLVVNALVLLSSFLQKPAITDMFPADFSLQIVEHSIKTFEDASTSKEIIRHLMFIIAQQTFSAKVLTQERVGRLIQALHGIENHIKGKSIATSRIDILRSLLRSSRSHMLANTVWFEDMFNDMLSSLKEIRALAISFGFEAAITLGAESSATRTVSNLFKLENGEKCFAEFYTDRLKVMVKNKQDWDSTAVPQIWSVVMLFLRSKTQALLQWQYLSSFLEVIQLGFNASDSATRIETNLAWNRLIYAMQLNERTPAKFRSILCVALTTQLKARKPSASRSSCLNSIYILLYYALKPQSTSAQLDIYWDEFVTPIIEACSISAKGRADPKAARKDALEACAILQSLFDSKTPRKWDETRAIDSLQHTPMVSSELPALDSKWLRKNSKRVFKVLHPLMEMLYWDLGNISEISILWKTYISSIGSPAVGEIIVSPDTMSSIASMFGMLHRFWLTGCERIAALAPSETSAVQRSTAFTRSFENIILTAACPEGLCLLPFTDKLLAIAQNTFIAVATPSQAFKHHRVETKSPLYHLILLLVTLSPGLEYDRQFFRMVDRILSPFIIARAGKAQLDFIYSLVHLLPSESNEASRIVWQVLSEFATTSVDTRNSYENIGDEAIGTKYLNVVTILEKGVDQFPYAPLPAWRHLFHALVNSSTLDAGDAGRAIGVIEPIAKIFIPQVPSVPLSSKRLYYLGLVLGKANYPKDRQALVLAHRKLGTAISNQKSCDPYFHLYRYTSATLKASYEAFSVDKVDEYSHNITAVTGLLGRCPIPHLLSILTKIQHGIDLWIKDPNQLLKSGLDLSKDITTLWIMVKKLIPRIVEQYDHTTVLRDLETLICAGLNSKHGTIVNGTITFWNAVFGSCEESFEYPENLQEALFRLRLVADVQVPHLPESLASESSADQRQHMDFIDTQDDSYNLSSLPNESIMRIMRQTTPQVIIESRRSMSLKRSRDNTPESSRRKSRKRDITPRLRHDDSQIQFEAVESSPMADRVMDSQLLTDKQKETKERQQAEHAMFPDLGSTPNPTEKSARNPTDSELELPTRSSSQLRTKSVVKRQTTPTLPVPSDDDGYVASSPTPTRSVREETAAIPDADPPSSPPVASFQEAIYIESESPSREHTPELALETAPEFAEPNEDDGDNPSPPEITPEPADIMNVQEEQADREQLETTDHHDRMDLDPIVVNDEDQADKTCSMEKGPELTNETASVGPSAQVESLINLTMSTFDFSPEGHPSPPADSDSSAQARCTQERDLQSSIEEDVKENQIREPCLATTKDEPEGELYHESQQLAKGPMLEPLPPGTPVRHLAGSESVHRSRQAGQVSSPTSSDREDVFEDAVSTPRPTTRKEIVSAPNPATPDFYGTADNSSFLRAVNQNQYDKPVQPEASSLVDATSSSSFKRETRLSASKTVIQSPINSSPARKLTFRKTLTLHPHDKESVSSTAGTKSSSIPSLIPETPFNRPAERIGEQIVDDDGHAMDPESTIIVDISSLQSLRHTVKGKKRGKKRKSEDRGDSSEIPDSQDAMAPRSDTSSPKKRSPSKRSPAKKRPRGRPSRASQVSQESSDHESSSRLRSQSLSLSVDLDAPRQGMEIDGTTKSFSSHVEDQEEVEPAKEREREIEQSLEESTTGEGDGRAGTEIEQSIAKNAEDIEMENTTSAGEATSPDVEILEEAKIDETTIDDFDVTKSGPDEQQEGDIVEEVISRPSPLPIAEAARAEVVELVQPDIPVIVGPEPEEVTGTTMISKLTSLVSDLQTAALSRMDVNTLEDLFYEAKMLLYRAGNRRTAGPGRGVH